MKNFDFETETISFEDSAAGKQMQELQQLRKEFNDYVNKQDAEHKANEKVRKAERKRSIFFSTISGAIAGVISGVVLYYCPEIVSFFVSHL